MELLPDVLSNKKQLFSGIVQEMGVKRQDEEKVKKLHRTGQKKIQKNIIPCFKECRKYNLKFFMRREFKASKMLGKKYRKLNENCQKILFDK